MEKYNLVFWFNTLSPHQLPYIKELTKDNRVTSVVLNVGEAVSAERKALGWEKVDEENLEINIRPSKEVIKKYFDNNQENSIHFFSGIRGFAFVFDCFKQSLEYRVKRGIITEAPFTFAFGKTNGKPLLLHKLRFWLQDRKYIQHINYVFAIGEKSQKYYKSISKKWKVIPFIYCTETPREISYAKRDSLRFIFVGNLTPRKSCITLIEATKKLTKKSSDFSVEIVGDGIEMEMLRNSGKDIASDKLNFVGSKKISEISNHLAKADVLVLPSLLDGWGAVVNEALSMGLFVICSDQCGAKDLVQTGINGNVFKTNSVDSLVSNMEWCIINKTKIKDSRNSIINWSKEAISGKVISDYFLSALEGKPLPPWKKTIKF